MRSENDIFVNYTYIQDGQSEADLCSAVPGFADPCPSSACAPRLAGVFLVLIFFLNINSYD